MRPTVFVFSFVALLVVSGSGSAGVVDPVVNGGFELFAPFGAAALQGTPVDGPGVGVGHQVLGCTQASKIVWTQACASDSDDDVAEAEKLARDPHAEVAAWTAPGAQEGDLVIVAPADQGIWYAAHWSQFPVNTIAFGDADGDGDREARILSGNQMLYQSFGAASPVTAIPAGTIDAVTARLEAGAPAGSLVFVLDSFPFESAVDWPQAFVNYQLHMPASTWAVVEGVVVIDPLKGTLSGPAAGAWIDPTVDEHPTAQQWAGADEAGRREILMQFRVTQMTFWNLKAGTQVDDVSMDVRAI